MSDAKLRRTHCIDSDSDSDATVVIEEQQEPEIVDIDDDDDDEEEEEEVDDEEDDTSAGLTATELRDERLFAGDTIEYYSMQFVFGDPRGHCMAKVLTITKLETEYPLRLDSQELLASTQMIKRKLNRKGEEFESGAAVWRKIRTFKLVDGEVAGKTRANIFNQGVKNIVSDSFKAVWKEPSPSTKGAADKPSKTAKSSSSSLSISSFFTKQPKPTSPTTKSYRRDRLETTSSATRPLEKKPRIVHTPTNTKDKDQKSPGTSLASMSRARDFEKKTTKSSGYSNRHSHSHSSSQRPRSRHHSDRYADEEDDSSSSPFERRREKKPKPPAAHHGGNQKIKLLTFVDQIEERKQRPSTDLNSYLMLHEQQKEMISELKQSTNDRDGRDERRRLPTSSSSSSGVSRMRASNQSSSQRQTSKSAKTKSLHNYFGSKPRPHPCGKRSQDADESSKANTLSFIMESESSGGGGGGSATTTSRGKAGAVASKSYSKSHTMSKALPPSATRENLMGKWVSNKR